MPDEYFDSDWGRCICDENGYNPDCPLFDGNEHEEED